MIGHLTRHTIPLQSLSCHRHVLSLVWQGSSSRQSKRLEWMTKASYGRKDEKVSWVHEHPSPHSSISYSDVLESYPSLTSPFPAYRILLPDGSVSYKHTGSSFSGQPAIESLLQNREKCLQIYRWMHTLHCMDHMLYNAQRQGRISFYMTHFGEEACIFGSATALSPSDLIFAQYREAGALLVRGCSLSEMMNQVFGNVKDVGKGRQMPVHYGFNRYHFITISSPIATQLPQSVGAAYALKLERKGNPKAEPRVAICYFSDGAASEGDFHAGLNFAATLKSPVIFFCRNNGYAISTPVVEQYVGDGIAARGPGYGIKSFRVDGNDLFAVYHACSEARSYALENDAPVLIEAMTYRIGHHSTSDDSTAYRSKKEVEIWKNGHDPIQRLFLYMEKQGWISKTDSLSLVTSIDVEVKKAFHEASRLPKPPISDLFTDVYNVLPWHLVEQQKQLQTLIDKYPDEYDLQAYFSDQK